MYRLLRIFTILTAVLAPLGMHLMAQPIGGPPPCWPPPCIPIDGGLGLLIAAGALLGAKRAIDHRRTRKEIH
jgi:hypothetical protein